MHATTKKDFKSIEIENGYEKFKCIHCGRKITIDIKSTEQPTDYHIFCNTKLAAKKKKKTKPGMSSWTEEQIRQIIREEILFAFENLVPDIVLGHEPWVFTSWRKEFSRRVIRLQKFMQDKAHEKS